MTAEFKRLRTFKEGYKLLNITELDQLLKSLSPELQPGEFVFCTVDGSMVDYQYLSPIASFQEREGLTLVVSRQVADEAGLFYEGVFCQITLTVYSSLQAVGLTAAVATQLASIGISANVIAAYHHDHLFVPLSKAQDAMLALMQISTSANSTNTKLNG